MTLIVAMKADSAIILAADSRGTIGDPRGLTAINDTQTKLIKFGRCGIGVAGGSEIGRMLIDEMRKKQIDSTDGVDTLAAKAGESALAIFDQWKIQTIPVEQRPGLVFTVAGYRKPKGSNRVPEAMVYMLTSAANFTPQLFGDSPCLSGVPQYAVYLGHRYYVPGMAREKAKALAEYLISETASQDPKVGGPIRMAEIRPDTGYQEIDPTEVDRIHAKNEELNSKLREFFLSSGGAV